MKITRLALAGNNGDLGLRSYCFSLARIDSAAYSRSCWMMEFSAIAPNPIAASCRICLRECIRLISISSIAVEKLVRAKHRLQEQPQPFLRIGIGSDRSLGNGKFFLRGRAAVSFLKRQQ